MTYTNLLKNIWNAVYDPNTNTADAVEKFFHQDYSQCINGENMNRTQFIDHVLKQKQNMTITSFDYKHVLEKDNALFAIYYIQGNGGDNLPIEAEVIAYFHFENKQILKIHGQTRLIQGKAADADMKHS